MTSAFVSSRLSRQKMETAEAQAIEFQCEFGQLDASELLEVMINQKFSGNIALVSSFGTEAAVLLAVLQKLIAIHLLFLLKLVNIFLRL